MKGAKPFIAVVVLLMPWCPLFGLPGDAPQAESKPLPPNAERARAILKEGLDSKDFTVRIQAITATSMVGRSETLLARLESFLHDKNVEVRLAAVHALADLHSPQSTDSLRKALEQDNTPEVSFAAAKVLAELRDPAGTTALIDVYNGRRKTGSNVLKKEERSTFEEFHSLSSALMFVIGKGIGSVPVPGTGEGFSAITSLLRDRGLSDRASVLFILARTKTPASLDLLRNALQDEDWSVRAAATQMVAHTAQTELRDSLLPLFDDKHQKVRFRAAGAYLHLLLVAKH
jgi:HEAT repeat protein